MIGLRIVVDTSGIDASLHGLEDAFEEAVQKSLARSATLVAQRAKVEHPYTDRTGTLTGSMFGTETVGSFKDGTIHSFVMADTEYASFVELGTNHAQPYPYLEPALENSSDEIGHDLHDALEAAVRRAGF